MAAPSRSRTRLTRASFTLAILAAAGGTSRLTSGCANLTEYTNNTCGDGVVDSNAGEDCDQLNAPGVTSNLCGSSLSEYGVCRWVCTPQGSFDAGVDGGNWNCPLDAGFTCGLDGVCRLPQAIQCDGGTSCSFQSTAKFGVVAIPGASDLKAKDLDDDTIVDIVATNTGGVSVAYFNADRTAAVGGSVVAPLARPSVADLFPGSDAGTTNIMLDLSGGLGIFQTNDERVFQPISNPTFTVPGLLSVTAYPAGSNGDSSEFFANDATGAFAVVVPATETTASCSDWLPPVGKARPIGIGPAPLCGSVAIPRQAVKGTDHGSIAVYTVPCGIDTAPPLQRTQGGAIFQPKDALGPYTFMCGTDNTNDGCDPLHIVDADGDGLPDLVVTVSVFHPLDPTAPPTRQLRYARQTADGGFDTNDGGFHMLVPALPTEGIATDTNGVATLDGGVESFAAIPLAVADLDHDGNLDVVDTFGIYLQLGAPDPGGLFAVWQGIATPQDNHHWSEALVGDFNGDGFQDVVVRDSSSAAMTLFRNTGSEWVMPNDAGGGSAFAPTWNPLELPTGTAVIAFAVGDFDGDLIDDIAFAEKPAQPGGNSPVSLYYGSPSGPPEGPINAGVVPGVTQVLSAPEAGLTSSTSANPYVVAQTGSSTNIYLFSGSTSRQVNDPYQLIEIVDAGDNRAGTDVPRRSAAGTFLRDGGAGVSSQLAVYALPAHSCVATDGGTSNCDPRIWVVPVTGGGADMPSGSGSPPAICGSLSADAGPAPYAPTGSSATLAPVSQLRGTSVTSTTPYPLITRGLGNDTDVLLSTVPTDGGSLLLALAPNQGDAGIGQVYVGPLSPMIPCGSAKCPLLKATGDGGVCVGGVCEQDWPGDTGQTLTFSGGTPTQMFPIDLASRGPAMVVVVADQVCILPLDTSSPAACTPLPVGPGLQVLSAAPYPSDDWNRKLVLRGRPSQPQGVVALAPMGMYLGEYQPSGMVAWSGHISDVDLQGATAIATGDFDGDGVDDIVVATESGLNVYYGASFQPGTLPDTGSQ